MTLTKYLVREIDPATGEELMRGEAILSPNVHSLETAHVEMRCVAAQNPNVKDPIYHYQICWPHGEQPTSKQWQEAAKKTVVDLGFSEHQYLFVAHDDKEHFHVHVLVNRVHPETYRAHYPGYSKLTLHKSVCEIAHEQGWKESPGLYRWDDKANAAVKNTYDERAQISEEYAAQRNGTPRVSYSAFDAPRGTPAKMEHYQDRESLQSYAKHQPALELRELMRRPSVTWDEVHALLHTHGLQLDKGDKGGYSVRAINSQLKVKASDVFRSEFAGKVNRENTEKKLGTWEQPNSSGYSAAPKAEYSRTPKRDPAVRAEQREKRDQERRELRAEFSAYRAEARAAMRQHTEHSQGRKDAIIEQLRQQKREIRAQSAPWLVKRAMLSHAVAQAVVDKHILALELHRERTMLAPKVYQQWVTDKAAEGDKKAAAQMRGWRYQDQRILRKADQDLGAPGAEGHLNTGAAADKPPIEVWSQLANDHLKELKKKEELAASISAIRWHIDRRSGDVGYTIAGQLALIDRGKSITVNTRNEAATVLALEMAVRKYGPTITATGSDEWKQHIISVAARHNIWITFTDPAMQHAIQIAQHRNPHLQRAESLEALNAQIHARKGSFHCANRSQAVDFIEVLYGDQARTYLSQLEDAIPPGSTRQANLMQLANLHITRSSDGALQYYVEPDPDRQDSPQIMTQAIKVSAERARQNAVKYKPHDKATTPERNPTPGSTKDKSRDGIDR